MAPDKIYVREYPDGMARFWENKRKDDVVATIIHEYIRKDALLEWAKEKNQRIDADEGDYSLGYVSAMIDLIDKLNARKENAL